MSNRIVWIDFIKSVAIILVIIIHSSSPILYQYPAVNINNWDFANLYDSMSRMAVPLFLMTTGALLLNSKTESLSSFYKKRFFKVLLPLLIWSLVYILYKYFILKNNLNILDHFLKSLLRPEYYHLWYLYMIIGIYLFLPIFKIFVSHSNTNLQIYFILLWVLSVSVLPTIQKFTNYEVYDFIPMTYGYIGYVLLGYLLFNKSIFQKISKKLFIFSILCTLICIGIIYNGTYLLSQNSMQFNGYFYEDLTLTTIIVSIFSFITLKYIGLKITSPTLILIIKHISKASLGIYLIHPIFLDILRSKKIGIELSSLNGNTLYMIPLTALAVFILSFIIIHLIRKTKVGLYITP